MPNEFYKSKIALFLLSRTHHIYEIRNNIPSGFDAFELLINNEKLDSYYKFIDHICSEQPFNCSIKTCYAEVYYCNIYCKWKIKKGSDKTDSVIRLLNELNELSSKASMLRDFNKYEV